MFTQEIRRKFLNYFRQKNHTIVPSSPLVPHDDPTLLFINAGMNQFKDVFLGKTLREYTKAASCQKCIRVGGKHNDLENVGHTLRHLTFFEMLGNFSFGDYFKKEAIQFSWEVATEVFGLEADKIWPTVFYQDEEAFELWKQYVPEDRITRFNEKNNFWAMGDVGPCGPCSELLYDRGPRYGNAEKPIEDLEETRFLEFWNLVFMQFNRDEQGVLNPLPKPSIDTGSGLERVMLLKMNVHSVYETDILRSIIAHIERISHASYKGTETQECSAFRVIADHLRSLSFAIADGVQPSNVDRGYVLRKVLRRAVRYARMIGINRPFLAELFPTLKDMMGADYPELCKNEERIKELLTLEEEAFFRTLSRGGNLLNQIIDEARSQKRKISGEEAFKLKDTYGFPLEEISLLAKDTGLSIDTARYIELEEEAKERSRAVHKTTKQLATTHLLADYFQKEGKTEFLGYHELAIEAEVKAILIGEQFADEMLSGQEGFLILDRTPFYAEMGGQVGDIGALRAEGVLFEVNNCQSPFKGITAHLGKLTQGSLKVGDRLMAEVDAARRQKIANNHTATHLLHAALFKRLGEHVKQAGSVVAQDRLRFDFNHHKPLTQEDIYALEDLVNEKIRENLHVATYELPYEEVLNHAEIKQFFGEKYEQIVRVVDIDTSKELCGGTHTSATGNIGTFRIVKEGSIAAGVRRIEACTGEDADLITHETQNFLNQLSDLLKAPLPKLKERIESLLEDNKMLNSSMKELKLSQLKDQATELLENIEVINAIPLIARQMDVSSEEMRILSDQLMEKLSSGVVILISALEGKCQLLVRVSEDLVQKGIHAKTLIAELAPVIGGGGGGKANSAQAGGKFPEKIPEMLHLARQLFHDFQKPC